MNSLRDFVIVRRLGSSYMWWLYNSKRDFVFAKFSSTLYLYHFGKSHIYPPQPRHNNNKNLNRSYLSPNPMCSIDPNEGRISTLCLSSETRDKTRPISAWQHEAVIAGQSTTSLLVVLLIAFANKQMNTENGIKWCDSSSFPSTGSRQGYKHIPK